MYSCSVWLTQEQPTSSLWEAAHENTRYLPGAALPTTLRATHDLKEALSDASMVVFVVPSHGTREVAKMVAPLVPTDVPIVSATKGIENDSLMFMDEVLDESTARIWTSATSRYEARVQES